jgi:CxxC motif-containing protein
MESDFPPKEIICVACPKGCRLEARREHSELLVEHAGCKRGEDYAFGEITDPRRMVASTVRVVNGLHSLVPVFTAQPFPKGRIQALLELLREVRLVAPVHLGQVVLPDALGSGIDVVASRDL